MESFCFMGAPSTLKNLDNLTKLQNILPSALMTLDVHYLGYFMHLFDLVIANIRNVLS